MIFKFSGLFLIMAGFIISGCSGKGKLNFPVKVRRTLRTGDIILQDLDCGKMCTAIEKATHVKGFGNVSHMGVYVEIEGKGAVIEAYGKVKITPVNEFLSRSTDSGGIPKIHILRLDKKFTSIIPFFIAELKKRLDSPYDDDFLPDNGKYYCSELVSDSLLSLGLHIMPRMPMSFGKKGSFSRKVFTEYFEKKQMNIPDGKPGTNPAMLLSSPDFYVIWKH
ncbi:MAG: hypothetical protein JXR95_11975 [Deltaproteobacteria bacterium]|nr:hypothetical protein [Deltaproteobacteria bacterium]